MNYGIYISAEGAMAQSTRLEVISNNLANAQTTGFKRDLAIAQARYAEEIKKGGAMPGAKGLDDLGGGVEIRGTVTEFGQGPMKDTGISSDAAILGDGFFLVRRGDQNFLTRAGNFQVSAAGELVTQEGDAVLSEDGGPILIDSEGPPWQLTTSGAVQQGISLTNLALVQPNALSDLTKQGDNLFASSTPPRALLPEERRIAPGTLEMSGVRPAFEMLEMIQTSRAFEANTNLIRTQDQLYGTLLSKVLKG